MLNSEKISSKIDSLATKWDISGAVVVAENKHIIHNGYYGYKDRNLLNPIDINDTYLLNPNSHFLLGLSLLVLLDQGKLSLEDKMDQFIPEYKHAARIKIIHLVQHKSGIKCFFYEKQMLKLIEDPKHQLLSDEDRYKKEQVLFHKELTFHDFFDLIKEDDLCQEPGFKEEYSVSNTLFLSEIIKRVSNQKITEFQLNHIFKPLKAVSTYEGYQTSTCSYDVLKQNVLVQMPHEKDMQPALVTTINDMISVMIGLANKKLLSKKTWKMGLNFDSDGWSIFAESVNGLVCVESSILGYDMNIYFDQATKFSMIHLGNAVQKTETIEGKWYYFRKDLRALIEREVTYPSKQTKLVSFNKSNIWTAMDLSVSKEQELFVMEARRSICMAYAYKTKKAYVLMESCRSVGLMVLDMDSKKNKYSVDILLVDHRYQHRGYGKIMLQKGLEILRTKGAKSIEIGVSRYNIAAQKLYLSLGFKKIAVYPEGMALKIVWDET